MNDTKDELRRSSQQIEGRMWIAALDAVPILKLSMSGLRYLAREMGWRKRHGRRKGHLCGHPGVVQYRTSDVYRHMVFKEREAWYRSQRLKFNLYSAPAGKETHEPRRDPNKLDYYEMQMNRAAHRIYRESAGKYGWSPDDYWPHPLRTSFDAA